MIRVSIVLFYHLTKAIAEGPMQLSLPRVLASMAHCNKIKGLTCIGTYVPYSGQKQDLFRARVTTKFFFFKQKKKKRNEVYSLALTLTLTVTLTLYHLSTVYFKEPIHYTV